MAAKAAPLRVLAACLACAAAERNTLHIVAHTAQYNDTVADDGLSYGSMDDWHSKALDKLDAFTSSVGAELESATAGALSESEKYSQMMRGLAGGFEAFRNEETSFRSANIHAQGKSNEEVRQVLKSARRTAMDQATVEAEPGAKAEAKANVTAEAAGYWQDQANAEAESEETVEVKDEDEVKQEEASHEAENLTGPNVSVPPSAGAKNLEPDEEEEATGIKPLFEEEEEEEASHKAENLTSPNISSLSPGNSSVENLEPEEDEEETTGIKPLFEEEEEQEGASHKAENLTSPNVSLSPGNFSVKNLEREEDEEDFEEEEAEASHKAENLTSPNISLSPSNSSVKNLEPEEDEEEEATGIKPFEEEEQEGALHKAENLTSPNVKNLDPDDLEDEESTDIKPLFEEEEEEEEEASHKAENLTGSNVSVDVAEADVSARKDRGTSDERVAEEAKEELGEMEADLVSGNGTGERRRQVL